MAEAFNVEPASFSAHDYGQSYFRDLPADTRFLKTTWHTYNCGTNLNDNSGNITINLKPWKSASAYLLDKTLLKMRVKLTDETGNKIPDSEGAPASCTYVSFANGLIWSIFNGLRVFINDKDINANTTNFGYKNYFENYLSYDLAAKKTFLTVSGYSPDTPGKYDDCTGGNAG